MSREPITLYQMSERVTRIRDGYHLNAHGRWAWLHRLLWRRLVKMKAVAPHYEDSVTVIRLPCDADTVLAKIMQAREGLFSAYLEPREILIGPETLAGLINAPEIRDYLSPFTIESRAEFRGRDGYCRMFDLPVHVVPTMEGVIVR